jgi:DNA primase
MRPDEVMDWKELLQTNGCTGIVEYSDWIMCNCIFHSQTESNRPSFGIHKETGTGNCFSCGKHSWDEICKVWGISSVEFIDGVKASTWEYFKKKLLKKVDTGYKRFELPEISPAFSQYDGEHIVLYGPAVTYFADRGINDQNWNRWETRFCINPESRYYQHIIFPIYDEKGLLFFHARYVGPDTWKPRWRSPLDSPKWKTFWNWEFIRTVGYTSVFFTEGITDAMKLWQLGFPAIAAKDFSMHQIQMILKSKVQNIFLCYDKDAAGAKFNSKTLWLFSNSGRSIWSVILPDYAKDPAEVKSSNDLIKANPYLLNYVDTFYVD